MQSKTVHTGRSWSCSPFTKVSTQPSPFQGYEDDDSTSISGDKKPRAGSTSSHISRDDTGEKATDKQTTVTLQEGGQYEADMDEDGSKAKGETEGNDAFPKPL